MPTRHVVVQGECLSSIAARYGFKDWRLIYDLQDNAEFRRIRPNPNIIMPGDILVIPGRLTRTYVLTSGNVHRFVATPPRVLLKLRLQGMADATMHGRRYSLAVGPDVWENVVGDTCEIECQVAASEREGRLTIWFDEYTPAEGIVIPLKIGFVDPIEEISGIQSRLNSLGHCCGKVDGVLGPKTTRAIRDIEAANGMQENGQVTDALRAKLTKLFGC